MTLCHTREFREDVGNGNHADRAHCVIAILEKPIPSVSSWLDRGRRLAPGSSPGRPSAAAPLGSVGK